MVHALKEIWRALTAHGALIDLRPICVNVPLKISTSEGWEPAGMVNRSPERIYDIAANPAMRRVVEEELFTRSILGYFEITYYWKNLKELKKDADSAWKEDIVLASKFTPPVLFFQEKTSNRSLRML